MAEFLPAEDFGDDVSVAELSDAEASRCRYPRMRWQCRRPSQHQTERHRTGTEPRVRLEAALPGSLTSSVRHVSRTPLTRMKIVCQVLPHICCSTKDGGPIWADSNHFSTSGLPWAARLGCTPLGSPGILGVPTGLALCRPGILQELQLRCAPVIGRVFAPQPRSPTMSTSGSATWRDLAGTGLVSRAGALYRHAEPLRSELACFASLRGL